MKKKYLLMIAVGFMFVLAAYGGGLDAVAPTRVNTFDERVPSDQDAFVADLKAQGALVFLKDALEQDFFAVSGQIIEVNGVDVQAYEYANAGDAQAQAQEISPDGSAIGTTMVMWVEAPHFYRSGRLLVLYVGEDAATLEILVAVLGAQFAGR